MPRVVGRPRQSITSYLRIIEGQLLPALNQYGIEMFTKSRYNAVTKAEYQAKNQDITIIFNSNHVELEDYSNKDSVVFADVFYGSRGTEAGVLDLSDVSGCCEQLYGALYEVGYRTEEDAAQEKEEAARKKAEEEKAKQEDLKKRVAQLKADSEEADKEADKGTEEVQVEYNEEVISSQEEFTEKFDNYFDIINKNQSVGSKILTLISIVSGENTFKTIEVEMSYISAKMCLVETSGVSPKVDKTTDWVKAKNYCLKLSEKLNGVMSVSAMNEEGQDIDLTADMPKEDDVNVDIDI